MQASHRCSEKSPGKESRGKNIYKRSGEMNSSVSNHICKIRINAIKP